MPFDKQPSFEKNSEDIFSPQKNILEKPIEKLNLNKYEKYINKDNFDFDDQKNNLNTDRLIENVFNETNTNSRSKIDFVSNTGLSTEHQDITPSYLTIDGNPVSDISINYSRIHFVPSGRSNFDPTKMTDSLVRGIQGIAGLIEAVDQRKVSIAPILIGTTNKHMALIAQRMGFTIVDSCRTEDGKINGNLKGYIVVGKVEDVRQKVKAFQESATSKRLIERQARLNPSPAY